MIQRTNQACKYFPCHQDLEDCIFVTVRSIPAGKKDWGNMCIPQGLRKCLVLQRLRLDTSNKDRRPYLSFDPHEWQRIKKRYPPV